MSSKAPAKPHLSDLLRELERQAGQCPPARAAVFGRRINGLRRRLKERKPINQSLAALTTQIEAEAAARITRRENLPKPRFPEALPISVRAEEIVETIQKHQVVVLAGETGSGKSTQIPKLCLAAGRGVDGYIGCTQPRRIAARSVATRVAEELNAELGGPVGFKVRFSDHTRPESYIKFMTDGILLAEVQSDRALSAYDTIIIDEAHERSLNIDFLLGYLKRLLPRRPDLKLIITSATIDTERFSKHFGGAPIIEVSGRTYPVEVRYRPTVAESDDDARERDPTEAILNAVDELSEQDRQGDILIFLPGEREIRETAEALRKHHPPAAEILPLFARQSAGEQDRIFKPGPARRIVLATNVAETSLTVPRIRYVVDPGAARISRYSPRSKVQRLPIEPISQASANQRKGRCGRIAEGVCIRLYSEDDFNNRPPFTDPEIRRTALADVILKMADLGFADTADTNGQGIADFPFVEPPDPRQITDGYRRLRELGALDEANALTKLGRQLARLPIDSRIGRMVLAAGREGSLREVLIIAAALSIQDPRLRPMDKRQAADEKHKLWRDPRSDFLAYVNLWDWYEENRKHLSAGKLRRLCREHYLSWMRMREWRDIHSQILTTAKEHKLTLNPQPAEYDRIHRALLTGLLGHIGFKEEGPQYQGARNARLTVFPGSGLFKKGPKWMVAAELIETTRLYAHCVAHVEPEWIEAAGRHLLKHGYSEPHWQKKPAQVAAFERCTLYGLTLVAKRCIHYGPIDPKESREIFIRDALVEGDYQTTAPFFAHNRRLMQEIADLEARSRRRGILVDEQTLYEFYDRRIPEGVYSGAAFEDWRKQAEAKQPRLLYLQRENVLEDRDHGVSEEEYPSKINVLGIKLTLDYHFDPGHAVDGVSVRVPLAALNILRPEPFEWLVPGLLKDKIIALIRALPKSLRRHFVPAPNFAQAILERLQDKMSEGGLTEAMARELHAVTGVEIPADAWRMEQVPEHLFMNFRVLNDHGANLAEGRDLNRLQRQAGEQAKKSFAAAKTATAHKTGGHTLERDGVITWDFGDLLERVEIRRGGVRLHGWPALVDAGETAAIRVFETQTEAKAAHAAGLRRLFLCEAGSKAKYLRKHIPLSAQACMRYQAVGDCESLKQDIATAVLDSTLKTAEPLRAQAEWTQRRRQAEPQLMDQANKITITLEQVLERYLPIRKTVFGAVPPALLGEYTDIRAQLDALIYPGFVSKTPWAWLQHYPRYLKALDKRLQRLEQEPEKDRAISREIAALWKDYQALAERKSGEELEQYRWLLEEYRVSLFAQALGTVQKVSANRVNSLRNTLM